jgi:mRNA interferase YafQ
MPLEAKYQDHPLAGYWKNHRDCHIYPDVVLIYRLDEEDKLIKLVRIGSHSELEL